MSLFLNGFNDVFTGLQSIFLSKDILVTDYIELTNLGAAFFNVGLVGITAVLILYFNKIAPNGGLIMALWLTTGFAFFGKNMYNIWPPMIGVYLFSKSQKAPFANYALVCLLSTSLAPMVSQISFIGIDNPYLGVIGGIAIGISVGFFLPPLSAATVKVHNGYNLYNVGFATGLIGTVYASIARAFGITIEKNMIWGTTYNTPLFIIVIFICLYFIIIGFYCSGKNAFYIYKDLLKSTGRLVSDFYLMYDEVAYINMGIMGIIASLVVILFGFDLNGPSMGGIFAIIGFSAFGKHIFNALPIMTGALICVFLNYADNRSASNTLAILFCTCVSPIAGQFGLIWGIIAGFLHVTLVSNIGELNAGLNLYNNGFTGGFVALILVPIITSLREE